MKRLPRFAPSRLDRPRSATVRRMSRTFTLALPDGRTLEAVDEGDPDGTLLLFHHGSPGAAVSFEPFDRAAAERGIRLVTLSRAGFGDSSRHEGRSVASAAADAAALADHLGAERFVTMGWSGRWTARARVCGAAARTRRGGGHDRRRRAVRRGGSRVDRRDGGEQPDRVPARGARPGRAAPLDASPRSTLSPSQNPRTSSRSSGP